MVPNRAAFEYRYGTGWPIAGEYTGRLSNAGERVALAEANENIIFAITYGTTDQWPFAADGFGPSLELHDLSGDRTAADHWQQSSANGGSPGLSLFLEPASVSLFVREGDKLRLNIPGKAGRTYYIFSKESLDRNETWRIETKINALSTDGLIEILLDIPSNIPIRYFKPVAALP